MITVRTYMVGDKRALRRVNRILTGFPTIGNRSIKELSKRTQISMKLRTPRDSGDLRKSITVKPVGQNRLEIITGTGLERPYDVYQDLGFRPHLVPTYLLNKRSVKFKSVIAGRKTKVVRVKKHKPFVAPTIVEYLIPNAPRIIEEIWNGFLREIGG